MSDKNKISTGFAWLDNPEQKGEFLFTFDGNRVFNLFRDYPHELSAEQKATFDANNPYWAEYFKYRS